MILIGKKVVLRPIEQEDIEFIRSLINDPWMEERIVGWCLPLSRKDQEQWYAKYSNNDQHIRFVIETETDGIVGLTGLVNIDYKNGVADSAGMRVKRDIQSKGVATDAYMTLFRYAFSELRLHRINTSALEGNAISLHVMEKVGVKREGVRRDAVYKKGKYHNVILCGILESDYWEKVEEMNYWSDSL